MGNVVNQVMREFNSLGWLRSEWQEHAGAVTGSSLRVQYAYTLMSGGTNRSRPTTHTYPNGQSRWIVSNKMIERLWAVLIDACDELRGVSWERQAAHGVLTQAHFGDFVGKTPTDRAKPGSRSLLLVEQSVDRPGATIICHMLRMSSAGPPIAPGSKSQVIVR